jgi:hypothetical protein
MTFLPFLIMGYREATSYGILVFAGFDHSSAPRQQRSARVGYQECSLCRAIMPCEVTKLKCRTPLSLPKYRGEETS